MVLHLSFLLYGPVSLIMIRRKNVFLLMFMANWQTKNISREMSPFLFNFNKKIYQKQKKFKKNIFKKITLKKK